LQTIHNVFFNQRQNGLQILTERQVQIFVLRPTKPLLEEDGGVVPAAVHALRVSKPPCNGRGYVREAARKEIEANPPVTLTLEDLASDLQRDDTATVCKTNFGLPRTAGCWLY